MADDDWFEKFTELQAKGPLAPEERQELRASMVLARVGRARRRRSVYWLKTFILVAGATTALAQLPVVEFIRFISRLVKGGG